jgi:hypothetical protein
VVDRFDNGEMVAHALGEAASAQAYLAAQRALEQKGCQMLSA